jgi:hypothetical protein
MLGRILLAAAITDPDEDCTQTACVGRLFAKRALNDR